MMNWMTLDPDYRNFTNNYYIERENFVQFCSVIDSPLWQLHTYSYSNENHLRIFALLFDKYPNEQWTVESNELVSDCWTHKTTCRFSWSNVYMESKWIIAIYLSVWINCQFIAYRLHSLFFFRSFTFIPTSLRWIKHIFKLNLDVSLGILSPHEICFALYVNKQSISRNTFNVHLGLSLTGKYFMRACVDVSVSLTID